MAARLPGPMLLLLLVADIPMFWGILEIFFGPLLLSAELVEKGVPWLLIVIGAMLQAPFLHSMVRRARDRRQ
jgi:hypothetical protein